MATSLISPMQSAGTTQSAANSSTSTNPVDSLTSESTFLKLLVSQIQHQDPLNPTDGVQFLTQLTGYSQLEQLMQINQELAPAATSASGTGTSSTNSNSGATGTSSTNPVG